MQILTWSKILLFRPTTKSLCGNISIPSCPTKSALLWLWPRIVSNSNMSPRLSWDLQNASSIVLLRTLLSIVLDFLIIFFFNFCQSCSEDLKSLHWKKLVTLLKFIQDQSALAYIESKQLLLWFLQNRYTKTKETRQFWKLARAIKRVCLDIHI